MAETLIDLRYLRYGLALILMFVAVETVSALGLPQDAWLVSYCT